MTVAPGRTPGGAPAAMGGGSALVVMSVDMTGGDERVIEAVSHSAITMHEFALLLEELLDAAVIDVTGLEGRYAIDVPGPQMSVEAFIGALAVHTGLILTPNASSRGGSR